MEYVYKSVIDNNKNNTCELWKNLENIAIWLWSLWDIEFWKYYTKSKYMLNSTYIMPHHDMGNIKDVCSYKIINSLDDISTNPY